MFQCTMCKARFEKQWMTGHRCHKCHAEYGQEGDREKLLKESNPDLYPAHEYVDVKVYNELVVRVEGTMVRVERLESAPVVGLDVLESRITALEDIWKDPAPTESNVDLVEVEGVVETESVPAVMVSESPQKKVGDNHVG